ncbi:hypothetical protein H0H87_001697 [Tephrocybe sp. NHM501043]|nr:hypothetical protein H0H87_001697 [Tephrocybe sp. NHM501043]
MKWMDIGLSPLTISVSSTLSKITATAFKATRIQPRGPCRRSNVVTCPVSANAPTFLVVDTPPITTTTLETAEDTPELGAVEEIATGTLEDGENNAEHDPSNSKTLEGECSEPQNLDQDVHSSQDREEMATSGPISDGLTREFASCPSQEEMLRHESETPFSTLETRHDATDATLLFPSPEAKWDVIADNAIFDSMCPSLAPHIVITPAEDTCEDEYILWQNRVDPQWPYYLCVPALDVSIDRLPVAEPDSCNPLLNTHSYPLSFDATPPVAPHVARCVFSPSKLEQSISSASPEHLDPSVVTFLQKALCKAAFFAASDVARVLRERYDSQSKILIELETPFTWSDPAEPILCANHRMFGATVLDSICPFLAPHVIINAPPPQSSQLTENNTTPYTQDAAFGDRLIVNAFATEIINSPDGWESPSYASNADTAKNWEYQSSYSSSTVDLLESATEYSRPGTPLPETPVDDDGDRHSFYARQDDDEVEEGCLASGSIYGINPLVETGLCSHKLHSASLRMFYIDEDDDELPSLDGW